MISYNHEKYILQALESIAMQDFDSPIEIVIGDDASSDKTPELISSFKRDNPQFEWSEKLRVNNIGVVNNFADVILSCSGEYIAILEGDDYWINSEKLKTQVEFLDTHQEYSACYTLSKEVDNGGEELNIVCGERPKVHDLKYILEEGWFMRTATIVFRNDLIKKFPEWFYTSYSTDYILHVLLGLHGKFAKLDMVSAAYRKHVDGISWAGAAKQQEMYSQKMNLLATIDSHFEKRYSREIDKQCDKLYYIMVRDCIKNRLFHANIWNYLNIRRLIRVMKLAVNYFVNKKTRGID